MRQTRKKIRPPASLTAIDHASRIIRWVCCLAGSATLVDDLQRHDSDANLRTIIVQRDNPALFDWLVETLSYQGISDRVAFDYMQKHGRLTWRAIEADLATEPTCPKLESHWQFHGCRYDKISITCAEPDRIAQCPLPRHHLRNGRLNQISYSLYLFVREFAEGDLVGWIDNQIRQTAVTIGDHRTVHQKALIEPLRNVFGVSDKVLMMALSTILLSAPENMPHWIETGASMIAIDTLVHNFLHRTGILNRFEASHSYGAAQNRASSAPFILCLPIFDRLPRLGRRRSARRQYSNSWSFY
jgi:hypothetical protein